MQQHKRLAAQAFGVDTAPGELLEMELAADLLEVANEAQLDRFIAALLQRCGARGGADLRRALARLIKQAAQRSLPTLRRAFAAAEPAAAATPPLGSAVTARAARVFGLELEGLSAEDQEFELARRFVRFARTTIAAAPHAAPPDPHAAASSALTHAARRYAPGLLRRARVATPSMLTHSQSGRWVRQDSNITVADA